MLAVTGALGAARAGLELTRGTVTDRRRALEAAALHAFRRPQARVAEGRFLAASRNVDAMMDVSDGLSTDLERLCVASGCGATLERVPVAEPARALAAARGEDPERFALAGGEDFELLVAVRPRAFAHLGRAVIAARFGRKLARVGVLRPGSGVDGTERRSSAPVGITSAGRRPLGSAGYSLGAQATGADARRAVHAAIVDSHRLEIGQPAPLRLIHCVTDVVAGLWSFATNFAALRHSRQIVPWRRDGRASPKC